MTLATRAGRTAAAVLVPFLAQAVLVLGLGTMWPSAWAWMNALPNIWIGMTVIIGPSIAIGLFLLARAFGWIAAPIALVYIPAMIVLLSNWTGRLALQV
jgi:hypothetical protein